MTNNSLAALERFADALARGGYKVQVTELAGYRVLLGETAYALVGCFEASDPAGLTQWVADVQAALTQFAEAAPSPRKWDLYVLVHLLTAVPDAAADAEIEEIESDTRYARKFVRVMVSDDEHAIDKALRPLLPLRPAARLDLVDPLEILTEELRSSDLPEEIIREALQSFRRGEEVSVP